MGDRLHYGREHYTNMAGVTGAAGSWSDFVNSSGFKTGRENAVGSSRNREFGLMFSQRAKGAASEAALGFQKARAHYAQQGLGSTGLGQKAAVGLAASQSERVAGINAEVYGQMGQQKLADQEAWLGLLSQEQRLKDDFLAAYQKFSTRLGQQAAYDEQYKDAHWYDEPFDRSAAAGRLAEELGIG